jgi:opacity protein-like surface antigen
MKVTTWIACLAGLLGSQWAVADGRAGTWESRLGIAFTNSTDGDFAGGTTVDIESDENLRLGLGYHLTDNIELGGMFNFGQTDYKANIAGDQIGEIFRVKGDLDFTTIMFDATWNMMSGNFSPFIVGAAGWSWVDTNIASGPPQTGCWWDPWWGYVCSSFQNTRTIDGFTYQLGVGARYDFSSAFAVHASYRMTWVDFHQSDSPVDIDGFEISIGWKF